MSVRRSGSSRRWPVANPRRALFQKKASTLLATSPLCGQNPPRALCHAGAGLSRALSGDCGERLQLKACTFIENKRSSTIVRTRKCHFGLFYSLLVSPVLPQAGFQFLSRARCRRRGIYFSHGGILFLKRIHAQILNDFREAVVLLEIYNARWYHSQKIRQFNVVSLN